MKIEITTKSPAETEALARKIGERLKGGECLEFISDLGGGKTTFTRGLAFGAGCEDNVSSPTFTISQKYDAKDLTIYHYDFYRLADAGLVAEELAETINDNNNVVVVEWAQTVARVLPEDRIKITINKSVESEDTRILSFDLPESLSNLLEGLE